MSRMVFLLTDSHKHEDRHADSIQTASTQRTAPACMHFDQASALAAVAKPKWTVAQISDATKNLSFPEGTTAWDKYVAYNSFYDDLHNVYSEDQILRGAYAYFFADEDAPPCKIWHYMKAMGR